MPKIKLAQHDTRLVQSVMLVGNDDCFVDESVGCLQANIIILVGVWVLMVVHVLLF